MYMSDLIVRIRTTTYSVVSREEECRFNVVYTAYLSNLLLAVVCTV